MSWREVLKVTEDEDFFVHKEISHESLESLIQCGLFDMCACGRPDENIELVRDALLLLVDRQKHMASDAEWMAYCDAFPEEEKSVFGSGRAADFMWYWLDTKGFTEHGGSIPGWPTAEGLAVLEAIAELEAA